MTREVFDDAQLSAMTAAIDQIMDAAGGLSGVRRSDVARAVLGVCAEQSEFDPTKLAPMALERLVRQAVRASWSPDAPEQIAPMTLTVMRENARVAGIGVGRPKSGQTLADMFGDDDGHSLLARAAAPITDL